MSALLQKRIENARRREREALLAMAEPRLAQALAELPYRPDPQADAQLAAWHWPPEVVGAPRPSDVPANWTHQLFDDWPQAHQATLKLRLPAGNGCLWLGPELPLFGIDCGRWAELGGALLNLLPSRPNAQLAVVAIDASHGMILNEFVGSLAASVRSSATHASERVLELAYW